VGVSDTLQTIAKGAYGDSSLWYLIADANGLSGNADLRAGQVLRIPAATSSANNSNSFKPYDPSKIANDSPTMMATPQSQGGGCGGLGQVIVTIVSLVVTYFTGYYMGVDNFVGYAAAGAVGSIAGQAVGIAIGAQDSFSWKSVALAAIGNGVSQGVIGGEKFVEDAVGNAVIRGALSNATTQGIAIATGLQNKFSWKSVVASAAGAGIGAAVAGPASNLFGKSDLGQFATRLTSGLAAGLTAAALKGGKVSVTQVATDAFGNALGESLADAMGQWIRPAVSNTDPLGDFIAQNHDRWRQRETTSAAYGQLVGAFSAERQVDRSSDTSIADNSALDFDSESLGTKGRALVGIRAGIDGLTTGTQTYDRSGFFAEAFNYNAAEKAAGLDFADVGEKTLADSLALLKNNPDIALQLIDQGFKKIDQGLEGARKGAAMLEALSALRPGNYVELASSDWNSAWVLGKTLGAKSNLAPSFVSDPAIFGAFAGSLALTGDPGQTASQLRSLMQLQDDAGLSYFHSAQALEPASGVVGAVLGASLAGGARLVHSIPGIAASVGRGINAIGNVASDLVSSSLKRYTAAGRPLTNEAAMNQARVDALVNKAIAKGDPGVPELITQLEASGVRVKDTNHLVGQRDKLREVDIETQSGTIIQVKRLSSAERIVEQVHQTQEATGQHTVAYVVEQHKKADAIVRSANAKVQATNKLDTLLQFIKNGHP